MCRSREKTALFRGIEKASFFIQTLISGWREGMGSGRSNSPERRAVTLLMKKGAGSSL